MKVWERLFAQRMRSRGAEAVWSAATFAAIWPYVAAPLAPNLGWTCAIGLSLCVTLLAIALLRTSLQAFSVEAAAARALKDTGAEPPAPKTHGLPGRTALEGEMQRQGQGALGLVRFVNQPAMSAFNTAAASRTMEAFQRRLRGAADQNRFLARLDESTFAVWFAASSGWEGLQSEFSSIAYVAAQDIVDADLTVTPNIHVSWMERANASEDPTGFLGLALASFGPLKRFVATASPPRAVASEAVERFAMEQALRQAVHGGQLFLNYQPLVDAEAGGVVGAEVLLRWSHPTLGLVSPARFVPLLEETGLIHEIGRWTINNACRQLREWRGRGEAGIRLAINLSAVQLEDPSLALLIARTTAAHGLSPADIELELTETAAMEDDARSRRLFQTLREQGFGLALDDFGNGHSNLGYLKDLPITKLKIDRSFVTHVDSRPGSAAICKALVELGEGLGISVLAEGVERVEEVNALRQMGCSVFQGYYFSKPLSAESFTARLGDANWLAFVSQTLRQERRSNQRRIST